MSDELEWGDPIRGGALVRNGCILRTVTGSQVHGLANPGTDDRDEMAVYIEPPEYRLGLHELEHWSYRTQPEGQPSGPGDLDLVAYSLRKFCRLALKGSPTILIPLFAPPEHTLICTEAGKDLRAQAELFVAANLRPGFLGYLEAQRKSLLTASKSRNREMSEEHGYDTKYAMHALRVGYQGIEVLESGRMTLPVPEPERSRLMEIRGGGVPLDDVLSELDDVIARLESTVGPGMDPPAELMIEAWMIEAYQQHWEENWTQPGLE